jgi:glycine/D-amino acid oxidase-like deaminating enzyme
MERRSFLRAGAGLALGAWTLRRGLAEGATPPRRVVVAGAGIIGASIAFHLARRGAAVTLVEKGEPAGGATARSFAWINATFSKQPWAYFLLNRLGIEAWHALEGQMQGDLGLSWGGSVEWYADAEPAAALRDQVRRHQAWGYATRLVDAAELARIEPRLRPGPVVTAAFSECEGHVDPVHATRRLIEAAAAAGATLRTRVELTGFDARGGVLRAVDTSAGKIEAERVVLALGVDTPRVAALAGLRVPLLDSPGTLVHTPPLPPSIGRVVLAPAAHMKQKGDGRIVLGRNFGGTPGSDATREAAERLLKDAAAHYPALADAGIEALTVGWRPLPQDELPIVGAPAAAPWAYLAVMHSGVTLAPLVGRLAADELLDGVRSELLEPFRLARFG